MILFALVIVCLFSGVIWVLWLRVRIVENKLSALGEPDERDLAAAHNAAIQEQEWR